MVSFSRLHFTKIIKIGLMRIYWRLSLIDQELQGFVSSLFTIRVKDLSTIQMWQGPIIILYGTELTL